MKNLKSKFGVPFVFGVTALMLQNAKVATAATPDNVATRINNVRAALASKAGAEANADKIQATLFSDGVAFEWLNWGNWGNWNNWANWANWANWLNY